MLDEEEIVEDISNEFIVALIEETKSDNIISYDYHAILMIAYALNNRDTDLLDMVKCATNGWLEGEDEKEARKYLIDTVKEAVYTLQYYYDEVD